MNVINKNLSKTEIAISKSVDLYYEIDTLHPSVVIKKYNDIWADLVTIDKVGSPFEIHGMLNSEILGDYIEQKYVELIEKIKHRNGWI